MSESSEWTYNFCSQKGVINIILLVSGIFQTVLFYYHYWKHDRTSKLPHFHEYLELFAVVFFIAAIVLSEVSFSWNQWMMVDVELDAYVADIEDAYKHTVNWIGCCLVLMGNALFLWLECHLDRGIQSPLFLNDVSIHNIDINITHVDDEGVSLRMREEEDKADVDNRRYWKERPLVTSGPYSVCRHPIYLIWASWEFGYLLITGHWFEYLSFTFFIFVEALRVDIIDKSLLYKYQQEYVDYAVNRPNALFPSACCGNRCSIDLAYCSCCCCLVKRWDQYQRVRGGQVQSRDPHSKTVNLLVNAQTQNDAE